MPRSVAMEKCLRGRISPIKSCKLHYVVTDQRTTKNKIQDFCFLENGNKELQRTSNISFRISQSYYDRKLIVES